MKMFSATMPTKPAAIHSMVSMKRSMAARFMSAPDAAIAETAWRHDIPPPCRRCRSLLRQRVIFGERRAKLGHRRVRIGAGFPDIVGPGLDQRLGRLLPLRGLLRRQLVDFVALLR